MRKVLSVVCIVAICISIAGISNASTAIYFEDTNALNGTIMGFNFDIAAEDLNHYGEFDPNFVSEGGIIPDTWTGIFSSSPTYTYFEFASEETALASGLLGTFDSDVILTNWALGVSGGIDPPVQGEDWWVNFDSNTFTYTITGTPVPLPSALFLLGGGLVGLVCFRRKKMS